MRPEYNFSPQYPIVSLLEATARRMGLRWEARAIFLPRVADAVSAALTKHDQILLPASTRLGRVRPSTENVTVCVACDRPMRRKGSRNQSTKPRAQGEISIKAEKTPDGSGKSCVCENCVHRLITSLSLSPLSKCDHRTETTKYRTIAETKDRRALFFHSR